MRKLLFGLLALGLASSPALADNTIDTLGAAAALTGTESVPVFQSANPALKTTTQAIANLRHVHPGYKSTFWYQNGSMTDPSIGTTMVASTVYCSPWVVGPQGVTIKTLGVIVTTASNGSHISMAVYSNDATNFRPGALVDSIGSTGITLSASTGAFSQAVANTTDALTDNVYWACFSTDSATPVFAAVSGAGGAGGAAAMVGSATMANAVSGGGAAVTGVSCTAGTTCQGASFAWSGTTFTWPASLSSSTWADVLGSKVPVVAFQVN